MLTSDIIRNFLSALTIVLGVGGSAIGWGWSVGQNIEKLTVQVSQLAQSFREFKCDVHPNAINCRDETLAGR